MPDLANIGAFFKGLGSGDLSLPGQPLFALFVYGGMVILYHLWGWLKEKHPERAQRCIHPLAEGALHGLMVFLILTNPGAPRGFIYFQF
jgi:alginate O-acetyltransferase complex protein AlgI